LPGFLVGSTAAVRRFSTSSPSVLHLFVPWLFQKLNRRCRRAASVRFLAIVYRHRKGALTEQRLNRAWIRAHRRRKRLASLGEHLRPRYERFVGRSKRDHAPDRWRAQCRARRRRSEKCDGATRCSGLDGAGRGKYSIAAELTEARAITRDDRYASMVQLLATEHFGVPAVRALFEQTYLAGLRKAGMPEATREPSELGWSVR
jgi:hypothetical protein